YHDVGRIKNASYRPALGGGCRRLGGSRIALLFRGQDWFVLLLQQKDKKSGGFAAARVVSDRMEVIRAFIEDLTRCQRDWLAAAYAHDNRAFQHVHNAVCVVPVHGIAAAWRVNHLDD